jgi:hypothetical protein
MEPLTIIIPFSGGEGLEVELENNYAPGMKAIRLKGQDGDLMQLARFIQEALDDMAAEGAA